MHNNCMRAYAPGLTMPKKDEARGVMAEGFTDQKQGDDTDFRVTGTAYQAALVNEGKAYALAYLERLDRGASQPGDLALLLSFVAGDMLHGACRVIEKSLEAARHA